MYKKAYYLACMLCGCKSVHLPITKVPSAARESVTVVPIAMKQTSEPVCTRGGMETNTVSVFELSVVFSAFYFTDILEDKQRLL